MSTSVGTTPDSFTETRPAKRQLSDRARSERKLGWLLAGPAFVIMLLVTLYPILQALWDSLFSLRLTNPGEKEFIFLGNYATLFSDIVFWRDLGVTLLITVVTVAVELVLGLALALVMNYAVRATRGLLRTAILVPYGIITVVSAFAWFYAFDITTGYVNNWFDWVPGIGPDFNWFASPGPALTIIMASEIWKTTPFISLLLLSGLAQVPGELSEAARVDGATAWQRLRAVGSSLAGRSRDSRPDAGLGPLTHLLTESERETVSHVTAVMSLLEGHANAVMDAVDASIVPSVKTIRRRFDARSSTHGALDRLIRSLMGMDAKMRQYSNGQKFVEDVVQRVGMETFNTVWTSPQTLPTEAEIHDPQAWVRRVLG